MSLTDFLHGVENVSVNTGIRPVQTARSSVIGLIGTAPGANRAKFPLNRNVLVTRRSDMAGLGITGTIPVALDAIFDQIGAAVILRIVEEGSTINQTLGNVVGGVDDVTGELLGVHGFRDAESDHGLSPMVLIAPGFTHQRPIGVASVTVTKQGTGYTAARVVFRNGGGLTSPAGTAIVQNGKVVGVSIDRPGFALTATPAIEIVGDGTGAEATASLGASANPVVGELQPVADELRAHIIADGPNFTEQAAIDYRRDFGSRRVFIVEPKVSGFSATRDEYVIQEGSARQAGVIAKNDNESGFWESPSNKLILGIGGLARPIDSVGKNSRANRLNENQIATFIRDGGWYTWGNQTCSQDPKFKFLSVSRIDDMINISIARAHRWAVDRSITRGYFDDVASSVRLYLRTLVPKGAILPGADCWVDPALNGEEEISNGHATFDYDFTPAYPAERVTFRSHLVTDYIKNLFN